MQAHEVQVSAWPDNGLSVVSLPPAGDIAPYARRVFAVRVKATGNDCRTGISLSADGWGSSATDLCSGQAALSVLIGAPPQ